MPELEWIRPVELRRPIMVIALRGLFDAADAATGAIEHLEATHGAERIAAIDPEAFYDFTQERPIVKITEGDIRTIEWPANNIHASRLPEHQHDLLLLAGVEPHMRWRTFSTHLLDVARDADTAMVVTLGAMVGLAPHTRPLGVVGSTTNPELATRLGLGRPSYEGPTGLVGALHQTLDGAEIPVISLRVSVPHYVPGPPNPEATRSLLRRFELVTGVATEHTSLDQAAAGWRSRIDAAVGEDDELTAYVQQLEAQVDASDDLLPSGDDLAAQLEAFLREQDES